MNNRTLVTWRREDELLRLRVVNRQGKHSMLVSFTGEEALLRDCDSFVAITRKPKSLLLDCYWVTCWSSGKLTGYAECLELPLNALEGESGKALTLTGSHYPKLIFHSRKNLKAVAGNKTVRRKLTKFLRDAFHWPFSEEIHLYDDFVPYSFCFEELRDGVRCMSGGVILHGQDNLSSSIYSIHT